MSLPFVAPCFEQPDAVLAQRRSTMLLAFTSLEAFTHSGRDSVRVFVEPWKVTFSTVYFLPATPGPSDPARTHCRATDATLSISPRTLKPFRRLRAAIPQLDEAVCAQM